MINLYKQVEPRTKTKTMYPANKSHIASMNLRTAAESSFPESTQRQPLKNSTNRPRDDDAKSKSGHKYKKSLVLQETTIQLVKKSSEYYAPKNKEVGLSTERFSKEKPHKRSVDYGMVRMKTEIDEVKGRTENRPDSRPDPTTVEVNVQELRQMVQKLRSLKTEKENLGRELAIYRKQLKRDLPCNSVLRALAL